MTKYTTITVTPEMRDRLKGLKRGGESYSEMLDRVIDFERHALDPAD